MQSRSDVLAEGQLLMTHTKLDELPFFGVVMAHSLRDVLPLSDIQACIKPCQTVAARQNQREGRAHAAVHAVPLSCK